MIWVYRLKMPKLKKATKKFLIKKAESGKKVGKGNQNERPTGSKPKGKKEKVKKVKMESVQNEVDSVISLSKGKSGKQEGKGSIQRLEIHFIAYRPIDNSILFFPDIKKNWRI